MWQKKWVQVNDLSSGQYSSSKKIRFKTSILRSDLYDYSDAYIVLKGKINVRATANTAFKNNAPFRLRITKINITLIGNVKDLDIVMPMYNLLEYSQNYSMTPGSLRNYYRDEIDNVDDNASDSKSFKCKTEIIEKTEAEIEWPALTPPPEGSQPPQLPQPPIPPLNTEVTIPLKYLSEFSWFAFDKLWSRAWF